jgi:hypothetical protein
VFIDLSDSESSTQHINGNAITFVLPDTDASLIVLKWDQEENGAHELYLAAGYSFLAQRQSLQFYQTVDEHKAA